MGTPNVVPAVESPEEDAVQGRSTIKFPYLDQNDAVEIAQAVHNTAGNSCDRDALAGHLEVSAKGGGFNLRLLTAKLFGLITSDSGAISLTPLGIRVINPQQEKAARAESFLLVPLYKRVYDDYRGNMLPANPALEAAMERMGVAPKQKDKARQVFQRSAAQAGYFAFGQNRLVYPTGKATGATEGIPSQMPEALPPDTNGSGTKNTKGSGGDDPPVLHAFIKGLLEKLPEPDKPWSLEGRKKWLQTASNIFDLMYTSSDDDTGELSITLNKNSAN
jgi:hypothetical protein